MEGKGLLCGLCGMANKLHPSNDSKKWNTEAITQCWSIDRENEKMMQNIGNFIENEKKEVNLSSLCNKKIISALHWVCKGKMVPSKFNSLQELVEP